jgi:hypothetical protein
MEPDRPEIGSYRILSPLGAPERPAFAAMRLRTPQMHST